MSQPNISTVTSTTENGIITVNDTATLSVNTFYGAIYTAACSLRSAP